MVNTVFQTEPLGITPNNVTNSFCFHFPLRPFGILSSLHNLPFYLTLVTALDSLTSLPFMTCPIDQFGIWLGCEVKNRLSLSLLFVLVLIYNLFIILLKVL